MALSHHNFRIAGQAANSPKGNYFPIINGSFVCNNNTTNFNTEQILLLDPTVLGDADMIKFDINGDPYPAYTLASNALNYHRAKVSIKLYGLDSELVSGARKKYLQDCNKLINKAARYFSQCQANRADKILQEHFGEVCVELLSMADKESAFSSMIRCRLLLIPDNWAEDYIHIRV